MIFTLHDLSLNLAGIPFIFHYNVFLLSAAIKLRVIKQDEKGEIIISFKNIVYRTKEIKHRNKQFKITLIFFLYIYSSN